MKTTTKIKTFQSPITDLDENEVFVFGSNTKGHHIGGAAFRAYNHFGADWGVGEGICGNSYAIPTIGARREILGKITLSRYIRNFANFAKKNQNKVFLVTDIGTGIAGNSYELIASLFDRYLKGIDNLLFSEEMAEYLKS